MKDKMGKVRTVSNQNKPTTERNKRRQSEPSKDYTHFLILAILTIGIITWKIN